MREMGVLKNDAMVVCQRASKTPAPHRVRNAEIDGKSYFAAICGSLQLGKVSEIS